MTTSTVPRLSRRETAGVVADVLAPLAARGAIVRRPPIENLVDRLEGDRRAVRRMQRLRDRHGPGPVRLALPARELAFVLTSEDVARVLEGSPEPFALATREKRAALAKFQPRGVLITHGPDRAPRRHFNEQVLDTGRPVHRFGDAIAATVGEELTPLIDRRVLPWDDFAVVFWRIVRRVVLGDGARDDEDVTDLLRRLRADANWSYAKPPRTRRRDVFLRRLAQHLDRAEDGSLAARIRGMSTPPEVAPYEQVPQWLFAFDAAGMAALRALALVEAHDVDATDRDLLRATVLESIRLWPTTPAILRDTTADTEWHSGTLAAGTGIVVFAPFFHRDGPHADRFAPELWRDAGEARPELGLVPFSAGPGACPGRDLVLFLTTSVLATLLAGRRVRGGGLDAARPLPASLSPFRLRFALT